MPFNFINGALLWGSALISVPIIIHLLNRRRFKIVDWAAMEWLLLAIKQNKRRITLEQLILLALRFLIILLAVFAASRLFYQGGAGLVSPLMRPTTDWVIVLDDSYTLGQSVKTGSCFDTARTEVQALLGKVLAAGAKDSFKVLINPRHDYGVPPAPQLDKETAELISRKLEHLNPSDLKVQPASMLERGITELRNSRSSNRALVLVTDCRDADWRFSEAEQEARSKLLEEARKLGIAVYVVDVGPKDDKSSSANLAVVKIEAEKDTCIQVGAVIDFTATVQNFGSEEATNVPVKFTFTSTAHGPNTLPLVTLNKVPAGGKATIMAPYRFKAAGSYAVTVEIGKDALEADNSHHLAIRVSRGIDVPLVDGESDVRDRTESETFTLARSLRPTKEATYGLAPHVVSPATLSLSHIERANVIFLCNVARLSEKQRDGLRKFVEGGGGLVLFLGDQVDPTAFNRELYAEGKGIAPCELDKAVGRAEDAAVAGGKFVTFSADNLSHPLLRSFEGVLGFMLRDVRFYRRFRVRLPKDLEEQKVGVVIRYHDSADRAQGDPAIIEREIGKGRVVLVTSTADAEWSNWPQRQAYPIVMQELVKYLYRPTRDAQNLVVGSKYVKSVDPGRYELNVRVAPPKGGLMRRAAQVDASNEAQVTIEETTNAGLYTVALTPREAAGNATDSEYFVANLDKTHSNLRRPPDLTAFRERLTQMGVTYGVSADDIWQVAPEERVNLWHLVIVAMGCAMAVESFLGWKFGHHAK